MYCDPQTIRDLVEREPLPAAETAAATVCLVW